MTLDRKTRESLIRLIDSKINDTYMANASGTRPSEVVDKCTMMMKDAISKCNFYIYGGKMHFYNERFYVGIEREEYEYILDAVMDKRGVPAAEMTRKGIYMACWRKVIGNNVDTVNKSLVCFTNGVVNFDDPEPVLKPHNPKFPVFYMLPYPYNPKAVCPKWETFLEEVLPDETLRHNLQEFLGLVFINRSHAKIETMLWLHGNGANGKSVIFNTMMGVFGKANISNYDIKDLTAATQKERNIAAINGKLLNYCSDVDSKTIINDSIKALISGEPMMGRPMYKEGFTVYDIPLMMGNTNRVPYFKEDSDAWLRRIRPIPFEITIPEDKQDKTLVDKLSKEYSGILNWILDGRKRIIKNKFHFTDSARIDAFLRSYREDGNPIKQFVGYLGIEDRPANPFDAGKYISVEALYYKYREWCDIVKSRIGETHISVKTFKKAICDLGFVKRAKPTGDVIRYFGSISLDDYTI